MSNACFGMAAMRELKLGTKVWQAGNRRFARVSGEFWFMAIAVRHVAEWLDERVATEATFLDWWPSKCLTVKPLSLISRICQLLTPLLTFSKSAGIGLKGLFITGVHFGRSSSLPWPRYWPGNFIWSLSPVSIQSASADRPRQFPCGKYWALLNWPN